MKLTANYFMRVRNIAPINTDVPENILELCSIKNGMAMVCITIDGQIEFTYSNQFFEASELLEIASLANSAHLIIKNSNT